MLGLSFRVEFCKRKHHQDSDVSALKSWQCLACPSPDNTPPQRLFSPPSQTQSFVYPLNLVREASHTTLRIQLDTTTHYWRPLRRRIQLLCQIASNSEALKLNILVSRRQFFARLVVLRCSVPRIESPPCAISTRGKIWTRKKS